MFTPALRCIIFKYKKIHSLSSVNRVNNNTIEMIFEGTTFERAISQKFIGVWFDGNLNWTYHVSTVSNEILRSVGYFSSAKHI